MVWRSTGGEIVRCPRPYWSSPMVGDPGECSVTGALLFVDGGLTAL